MTRFNAAFNWQLIMVISLAMMLVALFYQYSYGMKPCFICVQIRGLTCLMFIFAFAGYCESNIVVRAISGVAICASYVAMAYLTVKLILIERGAIISTCRVGTPFPDFMPLDYYIPWLFRSYGICGDSGRMLPFLREWGAGGWLHDLGLHLITLGEGLACVLAVMMIFFVTGIAKDRSFLFSD